MKVFQFNNKTYQFAEDITPPATGGFTATLVDGNNVRCEVVFENGELVYIKELA
ncbi:hypothetical protein [Veillonella caviae]|uniref:hypothetical protein n=1 Tax=Veillonella caviae TaxID=248316 RepID=UPI002353066D|nr:hypothetical protein [Veillonella caviae]